MLRPVVIAIAFCAATLAINTADAFTPFDFAKSFSTKTAYWDQTASNDDVLSKVKDLSSYTLVQIQSIIRHGTRYPTASSAREIEELLAKLQTTYAELIPTWLTTYELPYNSSLDGAIAPAGIAELKAIGKRTRQSLATSYIPTEFTPDTFLLQHTYKSRTRDSAKAFASTFFINPSNVTYLEYPKKKDPLLRFYDQCDRYNRDIKDNETALAEVIRFKQSDRMLRTVDLLKRALLLPSDADITLTDVESVYSACAFDLAQYGIASHWCTLLDREIIQTVELLEDLNTFYQLGGGHALNYEMASVLLQDIVATMDAFITGASAQQGNFRFVHAETTLPLITLLGYTDFALLRGVDWGVAATANRRFRTSRLAPFAANVQFRLYEKAGEHYVQILVNEQVARLPGCKSVLCKLSQLRRLWGFYLTTYDQATDCTL